MFAKLIKFNFARKVLPDEILNFLAHWRLKVVLVYLVKVLYLVIINLRGSGEEARNVLLENGESGVEILEHANNGILRLDCEFRSLQRTLRVKRAGMK